MGAFAAFGAVPAGAVVDTINGLKYGIEPISTTFAAGPSGTPLTYEGGPVVHSGATYAVFWDPSSTYQPAWQNLIDEFLRNSAHDSASLSTVFADDTQYSDAAGKVTGDFVFRGAYTDVTPFPKTGNCSEVEGADPCVTDAQVRAELSNFISANGLPSGLNPGIGATPIYMVYLPPRVTLCAQGAGQGGNCSNEKAPNELCGYHSFISENQSTGLGTILYGVQPWTPISDCQNGSGVIEDPSLNYTEADVPADVIVGETALEESATITDPLLNGWHDTGADSDETTDKCRDEFNPLVPNIGETPPKEFNQIISGTPYYLNDVFDQAALYNGYAPATCINTVGLAPEFTTTTPVHANDAVTFNTTESAASLGVAKYQWSFGDGTTAEVNCGAQTPTEGFAPSECDAASGTGNPNPVASVVHRYQYGGSYEVTLTLTDDGGHTASVTHSVVVEGPAPPPSSGSSSASGAAGSGSTPGGSKVAATPTASASILSHLLPTATRSGLVVTYTVNEQVAGYFQVMLASSLDKRLGIGGAPATGLPKGSPPERVIATALLVTLKGGRSTVRIRFSKRTAERLNKLGRVTLTLRLVAHNATSAKPVTVTVTRTATLVH